MEKTNDVIITLINGGFYEIFLIFAMYYSFVILLGIEKSKRRIFLPIFFVSMLTFNLTIMYYTYFGDESVNNKCIILMLQGINTLIYFCTLKVITKKKYLEIFSSDMIAQIISIVISFTPITIIAHILGKKQRTLIKLELSLNNIITFATVLVIMIVLIAIEKYVLKRFFDDYFKSEIKHRIFWWIIVLIFTISGLTTTAIQSGSTIFIAMNIIMIIIMFSVLYAVSWFMRLQKEKQIKKENQILSIENAVMKEYYNTLKFQMERTRKFRHDIEKHMNLIKDIQTSKRSKQDILKYVGQIEEQYNNLKTIDYCGNPVINAIFVNRREQCENQGINIKIKVGNFDVKQISEMDLVALLSNLFDLVIENSEVTNVKKLDFKCSKEKNNFLICIKFDGNFIKNKDKMKISVIKEITEKYQGVFDDKYWNGANEITIII